MNNSRNPGPGLRVRSLNIDDYDRGFLELLGQLTSVGNISREAWSQRFVHLRIKYHQEQKNLNFHFLDGKT